MEKTVLICEFAPARAGVLRRALARFGISVREVEREEYLLPLGYLAGVKGSLPLGGTYDGEPLPEEMLVFCYLTGEELDKALLAMRKASLAGIACKAVLTETNSGWNCLQLYRELRREHEAMHKNG